jgi:RNA-directed DNA polymerase
LGIPTLLDRIAQQVVRDHLEKQLEPLFHESSFEYRPGRNADDAVAQSQRHCFNHVFPIDLEIQSYFDTIDHDLMMKALSHYCQDKWVRMYVERRQRADILKEGKRTGWKRGTPQGGVISPLLSNLFLHVVFDGWMQKHHPEKPFERYADDIIVHCKTERQAQFMVAQISERMAACGLSLHPVKTRIVNLRGKSEKRYPRKYDFLGVFDSSGDARDGWSSDATARNIRKRCIKDVHPEEVQGYGDPQTAQADCTPGPRAETGDRRHHLVL